MGLGLYSVDKLKKELDSPSLSTKFAVDINVPIILVPLLMLDEANFEKEKLSILANSVSIGNQSISVVQQMVRGTPFNMRGAHKPSQEFTIKFYNDSKYRAYRIFQKWMEQIDNYPSYISKTLFMNNYSGVGSVGVGYMTNINIKALSPDGSKGTTFKFSYAFPVDLTTDEFDGKSGSKITETTVRFASSQFEFGDEAFYQQII